MPVRALLDSGADLSAVTTQVAKHLQLENHERVNVGPFGDSDQQTCYSADFTLSTLLRKNWKLDMTAIISKKITPPQPLQDASAVKEMALAMGCTLADPTFYKPGKIDVLIGSDLLPYVLSTEENPFPIMAVETIFGHAFMGTYVDGTPVRMKKGTIQVLTESTVPAPSPEERLNLTLSRFWELEQPPLLPPAFTPEEIRVQKEYSLTHSFIPIAGRYQVTLPRKPKPLELGESKTTALRRYHSNEKALLKKGHWQQFQKVMQEYLDLDHARPVTATELLLSPSEVFYLPMHGVYKSSSSTTKLRVVFDASSQSSSGVSLNDTLAVGPMLHPTLDQILLRFRNHRVALTGDIGKMYREILLSPPDKHYHRFLWRARVDQAV